MRKTLPFLIAAAVALSGAIAGAQESTGLDVYFIDVEGRSDFRCSRTSSLKESNIDLFCLGRAAIVVLEVSTKAS